MIDRGRSGDGRLVMLKMFLDYLDGKTIDEITDEFMNSSKAHAPEPEDFMWLYRAQYPGVDAPPPAPVQP